MAANNNARIYAKAMPAFPIRGRAKASASHRVNFYRRANSPYRNAFDRRDDGGKFQKHAIAHRLDEPHVMRRAGGCGYSVSLMIGASCRVARQEVNVSSRTPHFGYPDRTDSPKIPNAGNVCHTDKSTEWATDALIHLKNRPPGASGG